MRDIAARYLEEPTRTGHSGAWGPIAKHASLLILGFLSLALYVSLYFFGDELVELASQTRSGNKAFFILPVVLTFPFSLVHGRFTDRFWTALGLKAKEN